jgi:hypothetical protein
VSILEEPEVTDLEIGKEGGGMGLLPDLFCHNVDERQ